MTSVRSITALNAVTERREREILLGHYWYSTGITRENWITFLFIYFSPLTLAHWSVCSICCILVSVRSLTSCEEWVLISFPDSCESRPAQSWLKLKKQHCTELIYYSFCFISFHSTRLSYHINGWILFHHIISLQFFVGYFQRVSHDKIILFTLGVRTGKLHS